jgi:TPR repeat protein
MDQGADLRIGKGDRTLAIAGAVAGAVPFMISSTETSSVTVNGKVTDFHYRDNVALAGGGLAAILGLFAVVLAIRNRGGAVRILAAVGVLALGGFQIAKGLGVFASAGESGDSSTSIGITSTMPETQPPAPAADEKTCATADACGQLARDLIKEHADRALVAAARACDLGSGEMCSNLGVSLFTGETGVPKDLPRAHAMFEKSCKLDYAEGCKNLGATWRDGIGVDKDLTKSLPAYQRACELGHAASCNEAGVQYDHGDGTATDHKRAFELFTTACKGKEGVACQNMGISYKTGSGVKKDLAQAYASYLQACDLDDFEGCNDAAVLIGTAKGVPKDLALKRQLYQKACDGKDELACKNLAVLDKKKR